MNTVVKMANKRSFFLGVTPDDMPVKQRSLEEQIEDLEEPVEERPLKKQRQVPVPAGEPQVVDGGELGANPGQPEEEEEPKEPEPEPDPLEIFRKRAKLRDYVNRFGNRFSKYQEVLDNHESTLPAYEKAIDEIRMDLECCSNGPMYRMAADGGIQLYETLGVEAGLQISGIAGFLNSSKDWKTLVDEFELRYSEYGRSSVEMRMLMVLVKASVDVHRMNSGNNAGKVSSRPKDFVVSAEEAQRYQNDNLQ